MIASQINTLNELSVFCQSRLDTLFDAALQGVKALPLRQSMAYSLANGGKRLRPLLVFATAPLFDTPLANCDAPAAAIEMIHTYSLIHDDLPCMDNADVRRGQPACHKAFTEGMAVLAGDALQTLAVDTLLHHPCGLSPSQRLNMLTVLSQASGAAGMASGQALDITLLADPDLSLATLEEIYRLKTGALLTASLTLGWIASGDDHPKHQQALQSFGDALGLAFQIQDDILDIEAESATLGKPQGIDSINNKNTYPHLAGMTAAKYRVETLYEQAMQSLSGFESKAVILRELAHQMLNRKK